MLVRLLSVAMLIAGAVFLVAAYTAMKESERCVGALLQTELGFRSVVSANGLDIGEQYRGFELGAGEAQARFWQCFFRGAATMAVGLIIIFRRPPRRAMDSAVVGMGSLVPSDSEPMVDQPRLGRMPHQAPSARLEHV